MRVREFVLAAALFCAVQPANAGPREDQLIASAIVNMMGVIVQSALVPDPGYSYGPPRGYRPYGYRPYGPPMRYYPEPQQNTYENWRRRNMVPYQYSRPPFPEDDDVDVAPLPPPVIKQAPIPQAPSRLTAFGPIATQWSSCLDQSLKEDTTNNPDAVLARCSQYTPLGVAALERDGYTRARANDYIASLVAKARQIAVAGVEGRQQARR